MKKSEIYYFHSEKNGVEVVYCKNSTQSYPEHNHVSVFTLGIALDGSIILKQKN